MRYAAALVLVILIGCAGGGGGGGAVPGGARLVAETPAPLTITAPEPGTVYLRERGSGKVAFSVHLDAGEQFGVDPATGRPTINGKPTDAKPVTAASEYELFFKPAGKREYHPAYSP
jgi:hypothetical protein